jgi:hypothetical protein
VCEVRSSRLRVEIRRQKYRIPRGARVLPVGDRYVTCLHPLFPTLSFLSSFLLSRVHITPYTHLPELTSKRDPCLPIIGGVCSPDSFSISCDSHTHVLRRTNLISEVQLLRTTIRGTVYQYRDNKDKYDSDRMEVPRSPNQMTRKPTRCQYSANANATLHAPCSGKPPTPYSIQIPPSTRHLTTLA